MGRNARSRLRHSASINRLLSPALRRLRSCIDCPQFCRRFSSRFPMNNAGPRKARLSARIFECDWHVSHQGHISGPSSAKTGFDPTSCNLARASTLAGLCVTICSPIMTRPPGFRTRDCAPRTVARRTRQHQVLAASGPMESHCSGFICKFRVGQKTAGHACAKPDNFPVSAHDASTPLLHPDSSRARLGYC